MKITKQSAAEFHSNVMRLLVGRGDPGFSFHADGTQFTPRGSGYLVTLASKKFRSGWAVLEYCNRAAEHYKWHGLQFVRGLWYIGNGEYTADVNVQIQSRKLAERLARCNSQQAIWDIAERTAITIDPTASGESLVTGHDTAAAWLQGGNPASVRETRPIPAARLWYAVIHRDDRGASRDFGATPALCAAPDADTARIFVRQEYGVKFVEFGTFQEVTVAPEFTGEYGGREVFHRMDI